MNLFRKFGIAGTMAAIISISGIYTTMSYGETAGSPAVSHEDVAGSTEKSEIVGNEFCPVTGEKINKNTEVTYKYNSKVYSFCCMGCIDEFNKNPDKYITIINNGNKRKE